MHLNYALAHCSLQYIHANPEPQLHPHQEPTFQQFINCILKRFFEISFRKLRHTMLRVNSPLVTSGEISSPIHVINFHTPNLTSQGLWFGWPKTQNRRTYMRNIVLNKRSCFNVSYSINTSINLARIHIFLYGIFSEMK